MGLMRRRFDSDEVISAIREAYRKGDLAPRENRLTVIEPGIDLERVPIRDLAEIQSTVAGIETETSSFAPLVSVFCGPHVAMRLAVDLYEMLWESEPYVQGRFFHTESLDVAGQILAVPGLRRAVENLFADVLD